jgi:hypothetical protein
MQPLNNLNKTKAEEGGKLNSPISPHISSPKQFDDFD